MELRTYLQILDRRKKVITLIFLILMVFVVIGGLLFPRKYEATTSIRVIPPKIGGTNYVDVNLYYAARLMNTYTSLVSGTVIQNEVMEQLGLLELPEIEAKVVVDSELIEISTSHPDPAIAAMITNTTAEVLLLHENQTSGVAQGVAEEVFQERLAMIESELASLEDDYEALWIPYAQNNAAIEALERQISNDQSLYNILKDRYEVNLQLADPDKTELLALSNQLVALEEKITEDIDDLNTMNMQAAEDFIEIEFVSSKVDQKVRAYDSLVSQYDQVQTIETFQNTNQLLIVDQAVPSDKVASPNMIWVISLGFVISLFIAVLIGFIIDNVDDTVYSTQEVKEIAQVPLVGTVASAISAKKAVLNGNVRKNEDLQRLQMNLKRLSSDKSLNTMILSNLEPKNGKVPLSAKLALEYSRSDINTVLIDANLRNPTLHHHFAKLSNDMGLSNVLNSKTPLEKVIKNSGMPNLFVMPAGQVKDNERVDLGSEKMKDVIRQLQSMFKMVVIDIAPVLYVSDADELLTYVDGVLVVVERGHSQGSEIVSTIQYLNDLKAPVIGCVVDQAEINRKQKVYQRKAHKHAS